jgi:sugar phosphate isomerase/epimerase
MTARLALHTWTLDTTPLRDVLRIAREVGWDAVELRRVDFLRAVDAGGSDADVIAAVRGSGLAVACVGAEQGWMFAQRAERTRLLDVVTASCRWAAALGCTTVMSPVDRGRGAVNAAAASVRRVGDIAAKHGVRLAIEFNSQAEQINALDPMREVLALAAHPHCGLLLDTYHLERSGATPEAVTGLEPAEIAYVQYSDVPRTGLEPGKALDRLPPGHGSVPFREIFAALAAKGYVGYLSYEAPNASAWARPAGEVAREALDATRAVLAR